MQRLPQLSPRPPAPLHFPHLKPAARVHRLCNSGLNLACAPELLGSYGVPHRRDPAYALHLHHSGCFVADAGW